MAYTSVTLAEIQPASARSLAHDAGFLYDSSAQLLPLRVNKGVEAPPVKGTSERAPDPRWALGGLAIMAACWVIGAFVIGDPNYSKQPGTALVEGLTIFAVFFVAAQALERLLEPLALYIGPDPEKTVEEAFETASKAVDDAHALYRSLPDVMGGSPDVTNLVASDDEKGHVAEASSTARSALDKAADAKAKAVHAPKEKAVFFWGVATGLAILASATLHLYFLSRVGIASPSRPLEILATGLIIGAGTKPLHDLVKLIEKKKEAKEKDADPS